MKLVIVHTSPYSEDKHLPWEYTESAFVQWVDQVLVQDKKKKTPSKVKDAIKIAESYGFTLSKVTK